MARRNGTGPLGRGPLSGRGLGPCSTDSAIRRGARRVGMGLGFGVGLGLGRRRGFGRGLGRNIEFDETSTKTQEELLSEQKEILEDRLNLISEELENL